MVDDRIYVVSVVWHYGKIVTTVRQFRHDEFDVAVGRGIGFAKLSARANVVGSPELFGQYTVESGTPATIHYNSDTDENITRLRQTHNRSKV